MENNFFRDNEFPKIPPRPSYDEEMCGSKRK